HARATPFRATPRSIESSRHGYLHMGNRLQAKISAPARDLIRDCGVGTAARLLEGYATSALPVAVLDPEDRIVYFSDSFAPLFVLDDGPQTFSSMISKCHATRQGPLIEAEDIDVWLAAAHKRRRSVPHRKFEIDFVDGRW